MARYHMLFTKTGDTWGPQFGDHDKATVKQEMGDTYRRDYRPNDIVILALPTSAQCHVDNAVRALNKHGRNIRA